MLDIDLEEELIIKFGGRFKLTVLVQKRMLELMGRTTKALVKLEGDKPRLRDVVFEELRQGKIDLAPREEVFQFTEDVKRLEDAAKETASTTEGAVEAPGFFAPNIKETKRQRIEDMAALFKLKTQETTSAPSMPEEPRKEISTDP
jgi:uncharacterized protein Yka (UPF0111/DUF47 family)